MTPVTQTKVVVRNTAGKIVVRGNCYAAAIASLLDLPITEVPNVEVFFSFWPDSDACHEVMNKWLLLNGYKIVDAPEFKIFHDDLEFRSILIDQGDLLTEKEQLKGQYYLVSGPSPRGFDHICIYQDGEMVHDPHPTREGILNLVWFEKLVKI